MKSCTWLAVVLVSCGLTALPASAEGQTGTLLVTVTDQTGAVIPGATVTATPADSGTAKPAPATTSEKGQATLGTLTPGRYSLRAEFPGFEARVLADTRIRAGENKQV